MEKASLAMADASESTFSSASWNPSLISPIPISENMYSRCWFLSYCSSDLALRLSFL